MEVQEDFIPTQEQNKRLYYTEFKPHEFSVSGKEVRPIISANIIYFGGTFETPHTPSTADLRQSWADYSGSNSFAFMPTENAEDVRQFIKGRGLKNVVLAGYSQGAMRAIELAKLMQGEGSEASVEGLVLLEPTGLYQQGEFELAMNFVLDSAVKTPLGLVKNREYIRRGMGVLREFLPRGVPTPPDAPFLDAPSLRKQIAVMSKVHPDLGDIQVPVVLMQGEHDIVSAHGKVVPNEVEEQNSERKSYINKLQSLRRQLGKKWNEFEFPRFEDLRETFLKQHIFPKSPYVKMMIPERAGHHGVAIFRPEEVAKTSLYMLSRWSRQTSEK